MGPTARLGRLGRAAVIVTLTGIICVACAEVSQVSPSTNGKTKHQVTSPAADRSIRMWCPAGLLCEAKSATLGWRIPAACEQLSAGRYAVRCVLRKVPWQKVEEFYRSRYPGKVTVITPRPHEAPRQLRRLEVIGSASPFKTPPKLLVLEEDALLVLHAMVGDELKN